MRRLAKHIWTSPYFTTACLVWGAGWATYGRQQWVAGFLTGLAFGSLLLARKETRH